jgi:hypothetical protein
MTGESVEERMEELLAKAGYPVDGIEKEVLFMVQESEKGPLAEATAWQKLGTSNPRTTTRIRRILGYLQRNPGVRHRILTGEEDPTRLPGDLGPASFVREGDPIPPIPFTTEDLSPQEMQAFIGRLNGPTPLAVHYGGPGSGKSYSSLSYHVKDRAGFVSILEHQATIAQMESNPQKTRKGFDRIIHRLFFIRTYNPLFNQWNETLDFRWVITVPVIFVTAIIATYIIWVAFP